MRAAPPLLPWHLLHSFSTIAKANISPVGPAQPGGGLGVGGGLSDASMRLRKQISDPQVKLHLSVFTQIFYAEKKPPRSMCTVLFFCFFFGGGVVIFCFFCFFSKRGTSSALQPLAIGDPTEVHCPQVCLWVGVRLPACVSKMCQGHCAVGVYLNSRLYIKVNILRRYRESVGSNSALAAWAFACVSLCVTLWAGMRDGVTLTLHNERETMRVFVLEERKKSLPWDRSLYTVNFIENSSLEPFFVNLQLWGNFSWFHFRKKNWFGYFFLFVCFGGWIWVRTLQALPIRSVFISCCIPVCKV